MARDQVAGSLLVLFAFNNGCMVITNCFYSLFIESEQKDSNRASDFFFFLVESDFTQSHLPVYNCFGSTVFLLSSAVRFLSLLSSWGKKKSTLQVLFFFSGVGTQTQGHSYYCWVTLPAECFLC